METKFLESIALWNSKTNIITSYDVYKISKLTKIWIGQNNNMIYRIVSVNIFLNKGPQIYFKYEYRN
jgi:hypothetical protein